MERLQKLLAAAGIASRRKAELLILQGRVAMDGRTVTRLGEKADPLQSEITLDGRPLRFQHKVYILLNKPTGTITSLADPFRRPLVMDLVREVKENLRPVGRLDADTEGLLLLTNDGELAYRLTHPRWGVEKVYHAQVKGKPGAAALRRLRQGVELAEGITAPARVKILRAQTGTALVEMSIHTGWRRQVRRMLEAVGHPATSLRRVQFGPLRLGNLPRGKWRRLNPVEVEALRRAVGKPPLKNQPVGGEPERALRLTRPAFRQEAQTRIRRGVFPARARTR